MLDNKVWIALEGIDGSGKDTQLEMLYHKVTNDTCFTREPGASQIGWDIREIALLDNTPALTRHLCMVASRVADMRHMNKLRPKYIIANRSIVSGLVYDEEFTDLNLKATKGRLPDLVIFLGVKETEIKDRLPSTDPIERKSVEYHLKIQNKFMTVMSERNIPHVILYGGSIQSTHESIVEILTDYYPEVLLTTPTSS